MAKTTTTKNNFDCETKEFNRGLILSSSRKQDTQLKAAPI